MTACAAAHHPMCTEGYLPSWQSCLSCQIGMDHRKGSTDEGNILTPFGSLLASSLSAPSTPTIWKQDGFKGFLLHPASEAG